MDSCSRVLKIFLEFSVSLYSRFSFLPFLNASIEGNVKKTAVERTREWSVVLWKIPSRTPLGQKGKQLHFTQTQLNRNKDFCGSGFGFFQSVRCRFLRTRVTKAQNDIRVKSKYRVRSIRLSFENLFLISIMPLISKWRQILLFVCLYNNCPSMSNFKVKIAFEFCKV